MAHTYSPAVGRPRQEDQKFKAILDNLVTLVSKNKIKRAGKYFSAGTLALHV